MLDPFESAEAAADELRRRGAGEARLAIILGSGLTAAVADLRVACGCPFSDVPGFVPAGVEGHEGRILVGDLRGITTLVLSGRLHAYEGHEPARVVHPVRAVARLGVSALLLTCSAGGIRDDLVAGSVAIVSDHLNPTGADPLRGPHDPRLGPRFPSLVDAYDPSLRRAIRQAADDVGVPVAEGVYAHVRGPAYETPADVCALRTLGADLVGMSIVPEVIAARQAGLRVAALSVVTNRAAGLGVEPPSHEEVMRVAGEAAGRIAAVLSRLVEVPW